MEHTKFISSATELLYNASIDNISIKVAVGSPSKLLNSVWCFRLYTIYYSQWWLPVHKITWPVLVNCDQVTLLEIEPQFKWLLTSGEFCREPKPWLFPGSSPDQAVFFPHCPLFCSLFSDWYIWGSHQNTARGWW